MKAKIALVSLIVGLLVPSLAQAQNVRTFGPKQASLGLHHE